MLAPYRLSLLLLLALPGCSKDDSQARVDAFDARDRQAARKAEDEERGKIGEIETSVRLRSLQAQVDALQQELGDLKNTRQALELDLINQRLTALEARQPAAPASIEPRAAPTPRATSTPQPRARPVASATPAPRPISSPRPASSRPAPAPTRTPLPRPNVTPE